MTPNVCWCCGKQHDGMYLYKFCSESCRQIYRIRRRLKLWVYVSS